MPSSPQWEQQVKAWDTVVHKLGEGTPVRVRISAGNDSTTYLGRIPNRQPTPLITWLKRDEGSVYIETRSIRAIEYTPKEKQYE